MKSPAPDAVRRLRSILDEHDYDSERLLQRFGISGPPGPGDRDRLLHLTREFNAENALVRLFLLGSSLAEEALDTLPDGLVDTGTEAGLLDIHEGRIRPRVVIVPVGKLLFASDAFSVLGSEQSADFIVPANTHAAGFLRRLTLRDEVGATLDLGCGCGIQALFAAAHSRLVVATDISEAAAEFTRFNAALNGIGNVEVRTGDRFGPVRGDRFDLIVSNPPFVPGPEGRFVYRDNNLELDEFCRQLIADAPAYLNDGGCLQLLFESVEIEGEAWPDRIRSWVRGTGCDAWVLHSPSLHPAHYVGRRLADTKADEPDHAAYETWVDYFRQRNVTAIHPSMITLRKRSGRNWVHFHGVIADVEQDAGGAVRAGIDACDLLDRCADDEALLEQRLRLSPLLRLEQQFARREGHWDAEKSLLKIDNGLGMDAEVDMQVLTFLHQINGKQTLRQTIGQFGEAVGAEPAELAASLLPVIRLFIGRGFVETVTA